jgi:hypothetical protein
MYAQNQKIGKLNKSRENKYINDKKEQEKGRNQFTIYY